MVFKTYYKALEKELRVEKHFKLCKKKIELKIPFEFRGYNENVNRTRKILFSRTVELFIQENSALFILKIIHWKRLTCSTICLKCG